MQKGSLLLSYSTSSSCGHSQFLQPCCWFSLCTLLVKKISCNKSLVWQLLVLPFIVSVYYGSLCVSLLSARHNAKRRKGGCCQRGELGAGEGRNKGGAGNRGSVLCTRRNTWMNSNLPTPPWCCLQGLWEARGLHSPLSPARRGRP